MTFGMRRLPGAPIAALLQQAMVSQFACKRFVADESVSTQARLDRTCDVRLDIVDKKRLCRHHPEMRHTAPIQIGGRLGGPERSRRVNLRAEHLGDRRT